jgi:hypothetical protein
LVRVLAEHGVSPQELSTLERHWRADRKPDEPLAEFLVRQRVLRDAAPAVLAMNWGDDLLHSGSSDLIRPAGVELLRQYLGGPPHIRVDRPAPIPEVPLRGLTIPAATVSAMETPVTRKSRPAFQLPDEPAAPAPPAAPVSCELTSGQSLGRCLITGRIAEGSYGVVYRALHRTLNIPVAVKVLHPDLLDGDSKAAQQFRTEAMLLARLNHPNIVRLWDFDDTVVPPYLVLEFIEGSSVSEVIQKRGVIRLDLAMRITLQVIDGLEAAHHLGIVHRDVKPANMLLTRDEKAKIADLGLATVADLGRQLGHMPTGATPMAGTVAYLAPEQASNPGILDHRSDIYSLGASFYHMVTGRLPFTGKSSLEVLLKHARETLTPPMAVVPELDRRINDIIMRMMAKNPADRYRNYDDLRDAIIDADIEMQSHLTGVEPPPRR